MCLLMIEYYVTFYSRVLIVFKIYDQIFLPGHGDDSGDLRDCGHEQCTKVSNRHDNNHKKNMTSKNRTKHKKRQFLYDQGNIDKPRVFEMKKFSTSNKIHTEDDKGWSDEFAINKEKEKPHPVGKKHIERDSKPVVIRMGSKHSPGYKLQNLGNNNALLLHSSDEVGKAKKDDRLILLSSESTNKYIDDSSYESKIDFGKDYRFLPSVTLLENSIVTIGDNKSCIKQLKRGTYLKF